MQKSKAKKYRDDLRNSRTAAGLCIMCGKEPKRETSRLGQDCHEKAVSARKKLKLQREKVGICGQCLQRPRDNGMRLCKACREAKRLTPDGRLAKRCRVYGITVEYYKKMWSEQSGKCKICGSEPTGRWDQLDIDHCHETGRVRGLLCHSCNKGIGCLGDDPDRIIAAAKYLRGDPHEQRK